MLPVADAFCRFNPIHGQGMSSAAKQARLLQDVLQRAAAEPDPIAAVQAGFMAEAVSVLETPWTMSTSADLAFPQTRRTARRLRGGATVRGCPFPRCGR